MLEDIKVVLEKFGGLYARGNDEDIPPGHFRQCFNVSFNDGQIQSRYGTTETFSFGFNPHKIFLGVINYDRFFLVLDDQDKIHRDGGPSLYTIPYSSGISPGGTDFSALNLYNRVYVSPNFGDHVDIAYQFLCVYDGTTFRLAGGLAPTGTLVITTSATAGVVSAGDHQFAVCFITNTGFRTPPSPLTTYTAPGDKAVDISNIPTGPTECVGRQILVTKAGETELFFAPGTGIINDNTTTSITLDFEDTDLIDSADYLNDIYERPPAGTQLVFYKGRLIIIGGMEVALASMVEDPETFSKVDGFLAVPSETKTINPPVSGWVLRDSLYISKFPGVYATQDNGDDSPNNWPVAVVDESIGCYPNGISSYTAEFAGRNISDFLFILTPQGVMLFDGTFRRPPMSWKIEDLWQKITQADINTVSGVSYAFWKFTISHDVVLKKFYINCAPETTQILYEERASQWIILQGDYTSGWDAENVRWSIWTFPYNASFALMALHPVDTKYALRIGAFDQPRLWTLDDAVTTDAGTAFNKILDTGYLDKARGVVTFYLGLQFRASGDATLELKLTDGDLETGVAGLQAIVNLYINSTAAKDWLRLCNFTAEKARLIVSTVGQFSVGRIEVKCKPMFLQRPQTY